MWDPSISFAYMSIYRGDVCAECTKATRDQFGDRVPTLVSIL